jgi:hypothetical protein
VKPAVIRAPLGLLACLIGLAAGCGPADDTGPVLADVRGAPIDSPALSRVIDEAPEEADTPSGTDDVAGAPLVADEPAGLPPVPPDGARSAEDGPKTSGAEKDDGPLLLTFDELVVEYDADAAWVEEDGPREAFVFPQELAALAGRRISIDGFVIPTVEWGNRLSRFALSADPPGCGFGQSTALDKWIEVELKPGVTPVEYSSFGIVRVTGTLTVGEKFSDYGYVESLYQLEADEAELIW